MMQFLKYNKNSLKRIVCVSLTILLIIGVVIIGPVSIKAIGYEVNVSNNVGTSQTVTITVDQGYYTGYYWGTNSNYKNNTYTSISSSTKTITKTVTSPGKYYFAILKNYYNSKGQISGSVTSEYKPLTFERINLNANGGTIGYTYLIGLNGNKITLPTPKREGYLFDGWANFLTSTQGYTTALFATPADGNPITRYAMWTTRELNENEETDVEFNTGDSLSYYSFKPNSTANYNIYTTGVNDTFGYLYDKDMNLLSSSNTGGSDSNFLLNVDLQSGEKYYIGVRNKSDNSGNIKLFAQKTDAAAPLVDYELSKFSIENMDRTIRFFIKDESLYDFDFIRLESPNGRSYSIPDELDSLGYNGENDRYEAEYLIEESGTYRYKAIDDSNNENSSDIEFIRAYFKLNGGNIHGDNYFSFVVKKGEEIKLPTPKRQNYIFNGWSKNSKSSSGTLTVSPQGNDEYFAIWKAKKTQKILANSFMKTYGAKSFALNAVTNGGGKLTYNTSNKKVATVSSNGKVKIKGCGKATIKISANETSTYKATTKKISITVKPGKIKIQKRTIITNKGHSVLKLNYKKQNNSDGYQVTLLYGQSVKIPRNFKRYNRYNYSKSRKDIKFYVFNGKHTVKIRAYKKIGKKIYYGAWVKIIYIHR